MDIRYHKAHSVEDFTAAVELFNEYATSLGISLSFQNFETELNALHVQYYEPTGGLWLAYDGQQAIGCAGIRLLDNETAELKRMYVREEYRGQAISVELLKRCLTQAKDLSYKRIRLDTLADMIRAQHLYKGFGFYEIPSYRYNPIEGTVYMEKIL